MYQEKRPTCITVIGWAWIVIGSLMFFSAAMSIFSLVMISGMPQNDAEMPLAFKIFPIFAVIQIVVAIVSIISGNNFLKLKSWARDVLEVLTWLLLIFVLGFTIFWIFSWISMSPDNGPRGFETMGMVMGIVITGIYVVPLGIMLKYLRGPKVKHAIQ